MLLLKKILSRVFSFLGKYYLPILFVFCVHHSFKVVHHTSRTRLVLSSDGEGYYLYLTAIFVNGSFENLTVRDDWLYKPYPATGKKFTKFTSGVAMLEAPFFLVAHGLAPKLGYVADGYSEIYIRAILIAAAFYAFMGLFFLKRVLEKKFSRVMVAISLISIVLGTNLYHYIIDSGGMSHAYSFFLFSVFLYLTPKVYEKTTIVKVLLFGVVFGWITLIRPTNAILLLYPIFYNISDKNDWRERLHFFQKHLWKITFFLLGAFLIFLPQLLYWKYVSGNYLLYSYTNESFIYWKNPQIWNFWFSPRNGWFIYTPLMLAPVIGLFFGLRRNENNHLVILAIFLIITYVLSSWWCWWFGGALGQRSYVEFYALFSFPLTWILQTSFQKNKIVFILLFVFLAWGTDVSLKLNRFHRASLITSDDFYDWEMLGKVWKRMY